MLENNISTRDFFSAVELRKELQSDLLKYHENFLQKNEKLSVFICGLPGSGKTHTVKNTFFFSENSEREWYQQNPNVFYFNCCGRGNVLNRLLKELYKWCTVHSKKKYRKKRRFSFVKPVSSDGKNSIWSQIKKNISGKTLILDEIDTINPEILYSFLEMENLLLFCIANKMVYENRIVSRIGAVIGVECYGSTDLKEIMSVRNISDKKNHSQQNKENIVEENRIAKKKKNVKILKEEDEEQEIIYELISKRVSVVNGDARRVMRYQNEILNQEKTENKKEKNLLKKSLLFLDNLFETVDLHKKFWSEFSTEKKEIIKNFVGINNDFRIDENEKSSVSILTRLNLMGELNENGISKRDCVYMKEDIEKYTD